MKRWFKQRPFDLSYLIIYRGQKLCRNGFENFHWPFRAPETSRTQTEKKRCAPVSVEDVHNDRTKVLGVATRFVRENVKFSSKGLPVTLVDVFDRCNLNKLKCNARWAKQSKRFTCKLRVNERARTRCVLPSNKIIMRDMPSLNGWQKENKCVYKLVSND